MIGRVGRRKFADGDFSIRDRFGARVPLSLSKHGVRPFMRMRDDDEASAHVVQRRKTTKYAFIFKIYWRIFGATAGGQAAGRQQPEDIIICERSRRSSRTLRRPGPGRCRDEESGTGKGTGANKTGTAVDVGVEVFQRPQRR